ncbi:MAG: hypothetical protein ACYC64_17430 [Armatimonadota bacterium]
MTDKSQHNQFHHSGFAHGELSIDYTEDSLKKMLSAGMGRPVLYLMQQDLAHYRDLIVDNCIHKRGYDRQLEPSRADYLLPLIRKSGEEDYYRQMILETLLEVEDGFDADQLSDFALIFAKSGDAEARMALYERFQQPDMNGEFNGAAQLVELDGIEGLLFVLDRIGSDAQLLEYYVDDTYLIRVAEERCGVEEVRSALEVAAKDNPNIAAFLQVVSKHYTTSLRVEDVMSIREPGYWVKHREEAVQDITWNEFKRKPGWEGLIGVWSRQASDSEMENVAKDVLSEDDPKKLESYLKIFSKRLFPLNPRRLIELVDSPSLLVSKRALSALANVQHDEVRTLFDRLIRDREWAAEAISLLETNYHAGDHLILEELLEQETDINRTHSMGLCITEVYKHNLVSECAGTLMLVYERTPCSRCRNKSVELLQELDKLPHWIVQECVYDAAEETRQIARQLLGESK